MNWGALLKPLPHISPHPKPEGLPKGKAVSIGIAFRCSDGIVLGAVLCLPRCPTCSCAAAMLCWEDRDVETASHP